MPQDTPPSAIGPRPPASPGAAVKPTDETVKDTLEAIVVAFILAFVFRAYVVEAFVIPTGSMAPTLLGEHLDVVCQQCGYRFAVDSPGPEEWHGRALVCPMCHFPNPLPTVRTPEGLQVVTRPSAGDRILVHKYLYSIVEPSRWDVVVFKNPQDPEINFIKRLVGLPGESLWIIDGNLYVHPPGPGKEWQIARKTDRLKVQWAVWQPIYHSSYVPLDDGRPSRLRGMGYLWQTPWEADASEDWDLQGKRNYRHPSADRGTIRFNFQQAESDRVNWYPYNEFRSALLSEPIEDVRIAATFQPDQAGLSVRLQTTARLDAMPGQMHPYILEGSIDSQGNAVLQKRVASEQSDAGTPQATVVLKTGKTEPFAAGEPRSVELWYVDQQASLWVDGKRLLVQNFDLPSIEAATDREPPPHYPRVSISVAGSPVTMRRVDLDRDIYYSSGVYPVGPNKGQPGTGVMMRTGHGYLGEPVHLEADEFFCLGDNSPMSHDSRYWSEINPWVEKRMFEDDHHIQRFGIVPRKLMMGRAFFVYFPAPFSLSPGGMSVFPNFGDMRFIH